MGKPVRPGGVDSYAKPTLVGGSSQVGGPDGAEMGSVPLDIEEGVIDRRKNLNQRDHRGLRCVGAVVKHGLAGEERADADAVHSTDQLPGLPDLDAVGPAEPVHFVVRGPDRFVDPAVGATRIGAAQDHVIECLVD